jgi:DNA-binding transcriptional LysR family regulator
MTPGSLRHLRLFLAVVELKSLSAAARASGVTQPAVTQAIAGLEDRAGGALLHRSRHGAFVTDRGAVLAHRVRRALGFLDPALQDVGPRLAGRVTQGQLEALVAVTEAENVTLAAERLGLSQTSVHRAIAQLEQEAGRPLFDRSAHGLMPTRACRALAKAAQLALAELDQARADLAEFDGGEAGRIVIGALPLSRSAILPRALSRFRAERPRQPVTVIDGVYPELLAALRRGDVDMILGALRDPAPIADVVQERLFDDHLVFIAGRAHPLAGRRSIPPADLAAEPWVVPRAGTPARAQFDGVFTDAGLSPPDSILETGSILLMREILAEGQLLGCISGTQAAAEIREGLVVPLDVQADLAGRPIGLTTRADWEPTAAQRLMLDLIRAERRAAST